jgi:aminoglycoside phosphotransferase (APT) family kinase protein
VPTTSSLVDEEGLSRWAADRLPGRGPLQLERVRAGHSNLTFRVRRDGADQAWILRRPPQGPLLPTAHDVIREFRVLSLLGAAGARVPAAVAGCADPEIIGAPFYLMAEVAGTVIREQLPDWLADDRSHPPARARLGIDLVDTLAELHRVPTEPFLAAGLGRASGYLGRQLRRWRGQREGMVAAVAAAGGQARELADYEPVRDWLEAHVPQDQPATVVHGDYKLDNVVARPDPPRVVAVLDWEMATVGDPRADLGYLLSFWPEPGEPSVLHDLVSTAPGFPTRQALVDRWAGQTGRDPMNLTFFVTLAIWKLAILLEASYYRSLAGTTDDPFFETLEVAVPRLLAHARSSCDA